MSSKLSEDRLIECIKKQNDFDNTDFKVIKIYERYVEEENEENDMNKILPAGGEVKVDEKMGYVSTVEDARKSLENIFKNNIEPNNP